MMSIDVVAPHKIPHRGLCIAIVAGAIRLSIAIDYLDLQRFGVVPYVIEQAKIITHVPPAA
jgi:hypothetical protein